MVVHEERKAVRSAILKYMRGEIDNFAFDDATFSRPFEDKTVEFISAALWATYDDVRRHSVSVSKEGWKAYRRCSALLETDIEIPRPRWRNENDMTVWPFPDRRSIFASRRLISKPELPPYDPVAHNLQLDLTLSNWLFIIALVIGLMMWIANVMH